MFPVIDYDIDAEEAVDVEMMSASIGRAPLFDFAKGEYVLKDGKIVECTQEEAVRQWVGILVKTAAEKFAVYDGTDFGTYIENYIGYKDAAFVASEIKRELEEKVTMNRAVNGIEDFEYDREKDCMHIRLTVIMVDESEVEVELDVE